MRGKDKDKDRMYDQRYRSRYPERIRISRRASDRKHQHKRSTSLQTYRESHREYYKMASRARTQALKLEAFNTYGGPICICCGETHMEFLSLDHIAGDGAEYRRQRARSGGEHLYSDLKKLGYPRGYRVLCMNCNFALGHFGYCPHGNVKIESDKAVTTNGHKSHHSLQLALLDEGKA